MEFPHDQKKNLKFHRQNDFLKKELLMDERTNK